MPQQTQAAHFGDLVAFDRPPDVPIIVNVPGRYSLSSKRNAHGERRLFACRALSMSSRVMLISVPVSGPRGERVIVQVDHFGRLQGKILRVLEGSFLMSIVCHEEERDRLAAKLVWFKQYRDNDVVDGRKHGRMIPHTPNSTLTLPGGATLSCLVIDMSVSGAAVSADITPSIGTELVVGKVLGRVVRRFTEGFAIRFTELQDAKALEERLICC